MYNVKWYLLNIVHVRFLEGKHKFGRWAAASELDIGWVKSTFWVGSGPIVWVTLNDTECYAEFSELIVLLVSRSEAHLIKFHQACV